MALGKDLEISNSGVIASYWRICRVDARFPAATSQASITISLEGWVNAEARASGKDPIPESRRTETIDMEDSSEAENLGKPALYAIIKARTPDFTDAEDV